MDEKVGLHSLGARGAAHELLLLVLEILDLADEVPDGLVAGEVRAELGVLVLEIA